MQICSSREICDAHPHERHFQSRFARCNAVDRISRWISVAALLAKLHYNTETNLSCCAPKNSRFVLRDPQLDSGVGTFLHRISKPSKILTASYFYAQWRIRQDLKEKDETGESLLKAEKTIPRKLKVAINELYPKLTEQEKEKWVEKEQEDTKRFEEEMKVFKEKIKEHKQELRNNKFIKGERLKGTAAGSLAGGAKSYLFQADHLYAQDIAKNYEEKMPDLVEKMKICNAKVSY